MAVRSGVRSRGTSTASSARDCSEGGWETAWRLCTLRDGGIVQHHASLTRFDTKVTQTVVNLGPGEYRLWLYAYVRDQAPDCDLQLGPMEPDSPEVAAKVEAESSGRSSQGPAKVGSAMRSVLQRATFGMVGTRKARVNWRIHSWSGSDSTSAHLVFEEETTLCPDDAPDHEIVFSIDSDSAPAHATFALSSTSTVTALNVAAQLFYRVKPCSPEGGDTPGAARSDGSAGGEAPSAATHSSRPAHSGVPTTYAAAVFAGAFLGLSPLPLAYLVVLVLGVGAMTIAGEYLSLPSSKGSSKGEGSRSPIAPCDKPQ